MLTTPFPLLTPTLGKSFMGKRLYPGINAAAIDTIFCFAAVDGGPQLETAGGFGRQLNLTRASSSWVGLLRQVPSPPCRRSRGGSCRRAPCLLRRRTGAARAKGS